MGTLLRSPKEAWPGTIRQDVNVSIAKGASETLHTGAGLIELVVEKEAEMVVAGRIRDELLARNVKVPDEIADLTDLSRTPSPKSSRLGRRRRDSRDQLPGFGGSGGRLLPGSASRHRVLGPGQGGRRRHLPLDELLTTVSRQRRCRRSKLGLAGNDGSSSWRILKLTKTAMEAVIRRARVRWSVPEEPGRAAKRHRVYEAAARPGKDVPETDAFRGVPRSTWRS
jgi:hypothetical protein